MIADETEYCTVAEAARALRVSRPTVWRWVHSGRLPAYRIGGRAIRIRNADLHRLVKPAARTTPQPRVSQSDLERYIVRMGNPELSVEEKMKRLRKGEETILKRRGGKPFDSSVPLIREAREEWFNRR